MVEFAKEHKRCAIWAMPGTGKTSAMEFLIAYLRLVDRFSPWLVLGPMRVASGTWPDDVARWEQFSDMRIVPLTGTPKQRVDKLKIRADVYTISYELAPWLVEHFMDRWPFRNVIADEADRLKGFRTRQGGERARSLGRIARNLTDRWINLTGTPSPNGLKDLWGQTWYLDFGQRLGRTYSAFEQRWFAPNWNGYGIRPLPHAEREIHEALKDLCITIDPKDYYDLREPIVTQVKVKLPPTARKLYKKLETELFAELGKHGNIEVFNAAALTSKCLQLANGAVYTQYPNWAPVHDEKIEAVRSVVAEAGGTPVLLAYQFKSDVARLKVAFPRAVELSTDAGMKAFRAGDAPIGLAHPKSLGHGIDGLQNVTNILIRYGHDWNLGERMQMLERVGPMRQLQAGLDRAVYVYDIVAEDTIDEDVIAAHTAKRSVQDALLNAMKRR
jgi:SNF2 family DNA or RNA helicase